MSKTAMKIEMVDIEALIPYARNARTHSEQQVTQIAASIREFGFNNPVLIDGLATIIAGHGRVLGAKKLGLDRVPCIRLTHMTDAQRRAYILADNRIALNSGWDDAMLALELQGLETDGLDLGLVGFDEAELEKLLQGVDLPAQQISEDEIPEVPVDPVTKPGDLWTLGKHRLLCGDSTKAEDVGKCLGGVVPFLCVTDPPYGVEYDANWRNEALGSDGSRSGGRAIGKVTNDDRADWSAAWKLFPGDVLYCWHAGLMSSVVSASLEASGFRLRSQIIWAKNHMAIGRGDYHWQHEPCWYAVREGKPARRNNDRTQTTLWEIDKPHKSETGHSTQKPVECMARPMRNHEGEMVYDPFLGSGTTLIAAEQLGRKCYGMEISPQYCDVIVKRWETLTGKTATLEASE
jgi:DNA modification methylase